MMSWRVSVVPAFTLIRAVPPKEARCHARTHLDSDQPILTRQQFAQNPNMTSHSDILETFDRDGYVIIRNAIDPALAEELEDHVHWLDKKHDDLRPESFHHGVLIHDPFIHRVAGDKRLLEIAEQFVGTNIGLYASHYIAKPPQHGRAVGWHQDGSYWPLEPMEVVTLWVAGSESTPENGCMRVITGSQRNTLLKKSELRQLDQQDFVLAHGMHPDKINEEDAVDIELTAGDVSIHNPQIIHGSNANHSDRWRIGLTLRYIPTTTKVLDPNHQCILLQGDAAPAVGNAYVARPVYSPSEHMHFHGAESWNQR